MSPRQHFPTRLFNRAGLAVKLGGMSTQQGSDSNSVTVLVEPKPVSQTNSRAEKKPKPPSAWSVVLLDDNDHTYEYVVAMMSKVFRHPLERGFQIAKTVDSHGRAVCLTTHRELAELKQQQVHAFGPDPFVACCAGSMTAILVPAEEEADNADSGRRDDSGHSSK
jgi:ATP-dependent Clp protease adaptor protein ClpS